MKQLGNHRMKIIAIILVAMLLMVLPCRIHSQTLDETDCKALLVRAEASLMQMGQYQCNLKVQSIAEGAVPETGLFQYSKGRYHLDFHEDETIYDGDQVMTWYKAFGEVTLQPWNPASDLSPAGILRLYENHHAQWKGRDAVGNAVILLTPIHESDVFYQKEIKVNDQFNRITGYTIRSRSYGNFDYEILNEVISEVPDDALFVIDHDRIAKIRSGEIPPVEHEPHGHEDE